MMNYIQTGFFDLSDRYEQLSAGGDPLVKLNALIDWKVFSPLITRAFKKSRKSAAGRKPYNRLLMFKILVLQSLYNLSDHQTEFQIRDRLSFMRFLDLRLPEQIPDEKTIWSFREVLVQGKVVEKLFLKFNHYLGKQGYSAQLGSIVDASIVEVPKQRNSREDNQTIKKGEIPASFEENPNRLRQKDVDARWVKKQNENYYGYKDHIRVDVKHKLIRQYQVTPASTHDGQCLWEILNLKEENDAKVWADTAYYSEETEKRLKERGFVSRIIRRYRQEPLGSLADRENRRRAKIRKRVEHAFGFMENSMNGKWVRTIGIVRAKAKIGLMNLVYNLCRYEQLHRLGAS